MSLTLPFIQAPAAAVTRRCGNTISGILEMPVLGGLTIGETALINQLLVMEQSSFVKGAQIADAIAKEESVRLKREFSLTEAFQIVEGAVAGRLLEPEAQEIRTRHAAKIEEVARCFASSGLRNMEATVTALINQRLDMPQWGLDDTRKLHRALFDDIWELAQDEQKAEDMPNNPPTEEELKKPQPEAPTGTKRRGKKSSTTSPTDTPDNSPEPASAANCEL
jgi:hypothetical protein